MTQFQTLINVLGTYVADIVADHPYDATLDQMVDVVTDMLSDNDAISDSTYRWLNESGRNLIYEMVRTATVVGGE